MLSTSCVIDKWTAVESCNHICHDKNDPTSCCYDVISVSSFLQVQRKLRENTGFARREQISSSHHQDVSKCRSMRTTHMLVMLLSQRFSRKDGHVSPADLGSMNRSNEKVTVLSYNPLEMRRMAVFPHRISTLWAAKGHRESG
jgi:hypothetical protein